MLTQDYADAILFRRLGTSRLLRTVCAAPTGAANMGLYGKMASVVYQDYPAARLILVWGVNPGASGIHLMPYLKEARDNGATIVVIDPRATGVARQADIHLPVRPGTDLVVALAIHRYLFEEGFADQAFLDAHTTGAEQLRERARPWTFERAAEISGVPADRLREVAALYARVEPGPGQVRLGARAQPQRRQRGGGGDGAAGGGRQVRRARRRLLDEQLRLVGHRAHLAARPGARHASRQHEPRRPRADRARAARRSRACSSTTATPR